MKTFEQIFREMFNEIYKSPEGWPDNKSIASVYNEAAKEYAKAWVERAALKANQTTCQDILKLKDEIDAQ